jgi:Concanavalin A-like lectin/glucanases superfamily
MRPKKLLRDTSMPPSQIGSFGSRLASLSLRAALAGGALAALVTGACSSSPGLHQLSEGCTLNSDCADPYLCALGKCRAECVTSADCAGGGTCVTDNHNGVCLTADEASAPCELQSDCPAPLACSTDFRCHNLCASDSDCNVLGVRGRICAQDSAGTQYCIDAPVTDAGPGAVAPDAGAAPIEASVVAEAGPAVGVIGPSGGTFGIDGVTITVPPGALDHEISISIQPISPPVDGALGQAYEIEPSGTVFQQPAILTFPYTDDELDGASPEAFAVSTVTGDSWQNVSSPVTDPFAHTISGTIAHLSPYALAPYAGATTIPAGDGGDTGTGGGTSAGGTTATAGASTGGVASGGSAASGAISGNTGAGGTPGTGGTTAGSAGAGGTTQCLPVPSGLVSWWRAEGDATDTAGINDGQAFGQVTYVAGKVGLAFQFQNMAYVSASAAGLPATTADRTLEAWVLLPAQAPTGTEMMFFYGSQAAPTNDFSFLSAQIRGPDNSSVRVARSTSWQHVAYTLSAGAGTLYLNGQSVATVPKSASSTQANGTVYIGGFPAAAATQWFQGGAVDELSIYDRALSSAEITSIYQAAAGKCAN